MFKKIIFIVTSVIIICISIIALGVFISSKIIEHSIKTVFESSDKIVWHDADELKEGDVAPDFQLETLSGETMRLSDYQGKIVVLNFWATWCPPCVEEMPHLQAFYENNKDQAIVVIAVNLTSEDNGIDAVEEFVKEHELTFPIPLDHDGTIGEQYGAFAIPTSYIIDADGVIRQKYVGPLDEKLLTQFTKPLLRSSIFPF